jgi:hypothetical protein
VLIPVADRRDLVFDPTRDLLYITTSSGQVQRYDVANQTLLAPWQVGTSLNGADITPDGNDLLVTDSQTIGSQGVLHEVDLNTGNVTDITYNLASREGGTWDVGVTSNKTALFSTTFLGSGWVPFRQLDLTTGAVTIRKDAPGSGGAGEVTGDTFINRAADGSTLFMAEGDLSSGPIFTYDAASDSFPYKAVTDAYYYNELSAVNRDGSQIATGLGFGPSSFYGVSVMDNNLQSVRTLGTNFNGGLTFDPSRDLLYVADAAADQVVAFDTNTWAERFRLDIGESIPAATPLGSGEMTVSSDGSELFMSTPSGVRMIDLPADTGVASQLEVSGFPMFISAGTISSLTVTARDAAGNVATGFTGTVHFCSTDPQALLQQDYTFTPDDQGAHTFSAALLSGGTFSITATDAADNLSGSETNIAVHTDPVSLIPVLNGRDLVYDDARGVLYVTTSDGLVQRYDVASQTLLAPWRVGASIYGADVTPDGASLYTSEGVRGATQGMLHQVNLDDGTVTNVTYNLADGEGGTWAVTIADNGLALFDARFEGSGWVPLRQIDLGTNTLSVRTDAPGSGGPGLVRQETHIRRGADRSLLFLMESNISSGPIFDYSANTDSFSHSLNTLQLLGNSIGAVSRDGSWIAMAVGSDVQIRDPNLNLVTTLPNLGGGLAFDPTRDILYAATSTQIIAYDTNTWTEAYRFDIGETVPAARPFSNGEMTVSGDGSLLFFSTPSGVRVYTLGDPASAPAGASAGLALAADAFVSWKGVSGAGFMVPDGAFGGAGGANVPPTVALSSEAGTKKEVLPAAGFAPTQAVEEGTRTVARAGDMRDTLTAATIDAALRADALGLLCE